jgi:arylesterase/paraoxonase
MPLDNLSVDANGDIYAAAFPDIVALVKALSDASVPNAPATVFRVRVVRDKDGEPGYEVEKVLEDIEASVLPMTTTAVHDVKTGRLFLGGVSSPFIAVCEPSI